MQGSQTTAQGLFSTAKSVTKMGWKSASFNYRALKGEVNFKDLLAQGGEKALTLVEGGSRYLVSGRLPGDAKKFAKDCSDYSAEYLRKVKNDPGLEVPKLLAIVITGAAVGGGASRGIKMAGKLTAAVEAEAGAVAAEEAAVAAPHLAAHVAAPAPTPAVVAVEEAAAALPKPGTVVPANYGLRGSVPIRATRPAAAAPTSVAPAPVAAPPVVSRAPTVVAAPAPVAPAPVQLPPSTLALPTRTPHCLPSSNYAPVHRGYLQQLEEIHSTLNLLG